MLRYGKQLRFLKDCSDVIKLFFKQLHTIIYLTCKLKYEKNEGALPLLFQFITKVSPTIEAFEAGET